MIHSQSKRNRDSEEEGFVGESRRFLADAESIV